MSDFISGLDPEIIAIAGDWHQNTAWALDSISNMSYMLDRDEVSPKVIIQLGDFGIGDWGTQGGNDRYLNAVNPQLEIRNTRLIFVDGNHEDFAWLNKRLEEADDKVVQVRPRIFWASRAAHWKWHGRTWLAVGGAVSVDRADRIPGVSWWADEEITLPQAAEASSVAADVMITHDCPSGVVHSYGNPPRNWDLKDIARSGVHQDLLQRIGESVKPRTWFHGHLHRAYERDTDLGWGPVKVIGLAEDGRDDNWVLYNVATMDWAT